MFICLHGVIVMIVYDGVFPLFVAWCKVVDPLVAFHPKPDAPSDVKGPW